MSILLKLGSEGNEVKALTRLLQSRGRLAEETSRFDGGVKTAVLGCARVQDSMS